VSCLTQERKYNGQHATDDGKICRQSGRVGGREDASVHGGEEKGRPAALQHDARVSSSNFCFGLMKNERFQDISHNIEIFEL